MAPRVELFRHLIETHHIPVTESGCWIWLRGAGKDGYGLIRLGKETIRAHRASWIAFRGEIPEGSRVLHRCDVPLCINPDHLWLGSAAENTHDMIAKGRWRSGDSRFKPICLLTPEEIQDRCQ